MFQVAFTELDDFGPGDALAQTTQYYKHEYIFKFMLETAFTGSTVFVY